MIVGAGVAGLTLGHELQRAGHSVTMIELLPEIGGLARSFNYGDFWFDLGPHRFHTENPRVDGFIRQTLGDNLVEIPRRSGVWFFDRLHEWPLQSSSLFKIPKRYLLRAGFDLVRRHKPTSESFEDFVLSRYGRTIYELFFRPYTEKFIKYRCDQLHSSWAKAGINRAVIDKRSEVGGLWKLMSKTLFPEKVDTMFVYPKYGAIATYSNNLGEKITGMGGRILTDTRIESFRLDGDRVAACVDSHGESHEVDHIFWTGKLPTLQRLLELENPELEYLSSIFLNFMVDGELDHDYQWIYYGGPDLVFSRASFPTLFSPHTAPEGKHGICVEVACIEGDGVWKNPDWKLGDVRSQMLKVGLLKRPNDVDDVRIEKVKNTYPIYTMGYQDRRSSAQEKMRAKVKNVNLLGRTGNFWYNNMDHSIAQALKMARKFVKQEGDAGVGTDEIFEG